MRRAATIAGACAALGACALLPTVPRPKPVNSYRADHRDLHDLRRVIALPFVQAPGVDADRQALEQVRSAFLDELAKLQLFELVPLPDGADEDEQLYRGIARGELRAAALVALGKRYHVDGVLLGVVTSYRPYVPPHLGLRAQLVSVHSGGTVWAAGGHYDAADAATTADLRHYARSFLTEATSDHDWRINLISPSKFAAFVSHRLVGSWR